MDTLQELFAHELKDMYDAETRLVDALDEMIKETEDTEIKNAFTSHRKETQGHKERLEKVFEMIGQKASRGKGCEGIKGLIDEHKEFKDERPSKPLLDVYNLTAGSKVERYEITAYESLIRVGQKLGHTEAVKHLEKNLQEEKAALEKLQGFAKQEDRLRVAGKQ